MKEAAPLLSSLRLDRRRAIREVLSPIGSSPGATIAAYDASGRASDEQRDRFIASPAPLPRPIKPLEVVCLAVPSSAAATYGPVFVSRRRGRR